MSAVDATGGGAGSDHLWHCTTLSLTDCGENPPNVMRCSLPVNSMGWGILTLMKSPSFSPLNGDGSDLDIYFLQGVSWKWDNDIVMNIHEIGNYMLLYISSAKWRTLTKTTRVFSVNNHSKRLFRASILCSSRHGGKWTREGVPPQCLLFQGGSASRVCVECCQRSQTTDILLMEAISQPANSSFHNSGWFPVEIPTSNCNFPNSNGSFPVTGWLRWRQFVTT